MTIKVLDGIYMGLAQPASGGATINNQDITFYSNGTYTADEGYTGFGEVTVDTPEPTGTKSITTNGTHNVAYYASADVNVGGLVENFTKHGTLTFSGSAESGTRAVSGFSASNYLTTNEVVSWGSGAWNIHIRFKYKEANHIQAIIGNSTNVGSQGLSMTIDGTDKKIKFFLSSNGTSNDILNGGSATYTFTDGKEYDVNFFFTGASYGYTVLADGANGISESLVTSSTPLFASTLVKAIGNNLTGSTNYFEGDIYLDDLTIRTADGSFDWVAEEVLQDKQKYGATIGNFLGDVDANGVYQAPNEDINLVFNGVVSLSDECFKYAFASNKKIKSVRFPDLEKFKADSQVGYANFQYAFQNCTSLTSVSFDIIETLNVNDSFLYAFQNCSNLTNVSFPKVKVITGTLGNNPFEMCGITSNPFPNVEELGYRSLRYCFFRCNGLTSVSFDKLKSLEYQQSLQQAFGYCSSLTSLSFPALKSTSFSSSTNQFNNMLSGCTGVTVHFPSNLQSVIGSWSDVTNGFGGTNTTVLYDLPATE